jgi:hypothetical protein
MKWDASPSAKKAKSSWVGGRSISLAVSMTGDALFIGIVLLNDPDHCATTSQSPKSKPRAGRIWPKSRAAKASLPQFNAQFTRIRLNLSSIHEALIV